MNYQEACRFLRVSLNASINEIKKAFHKLILEHHPDRGGSDEMTRKILEAYRICMGLSGIDGLVEYIWMLKRPLFPSSLGAGFINPLKILHNRLVDVMKGYAFKQHGKIIQKLTREKAKSLLIENPDLLNNVLDLKKQFWDRYYGPGVA